MRFIKFLLATAVTVGLIFILNSYNAFGISNLPAMGKWLDPFGGFWNNSRPEASLTQESLSFPDLKAPVQVAYDERLVPHIFAQNLEDALFVQGYLEARHRLWQMDLMARASAGRLAEVFGKDLVDYDQVQRRKGMSMAAQRAVTGWVETGGDRMNTFTRYVDGVNAYIDQLDEADYPVEFKLLGYAPERWSAYHSALISKRMAQTLNSREDDLETSNTLQALGAETFNFLFPEYNPKQAPIIEDAALPTLFDSLPPLVPDPGESIFGRYRRPEPQPSPYLGSNNWAVAGSKTANGYPILCNDPHLQLTLPSIWFEVQLHIPEFNAYGVSVPGLPGIMIGFNEYIAWGETNVSHDVLDWYELDWTNEQHTRYRFDGEEREVEYHTETIEVKGGKTVFDTVRYTHLGPITYDTGDRGGLVMRWLAHDKPTSFEPATFIDLCGAKNYEDYVRALEEYVSPAQNFVFASRDGDIALWVNGVLPLKRPGQGRTVALADGTEDLWQGTIPREHLAHQRNPARGYIGSANQHSTSPEYPYYYNGVFDDYRGRILDRALQQMDSITVEDMMALQTSNYSILAEEATPLLLAKLDTTRLNTVHMGLLELLRNWDFRFDTDARAAVLFEEWWTQFYRLSWDEFYTLEEEQSILFPETWRTLDLLETDPLNVYWDDRSTPEREGPKEIVTRAFLQMYEDMSPKLEQTDYDWGLHHTVQIRHLARLPAFSVAEVEAGGYPQALNAIKTTSGPSWRMVVELGPEVKGYGIYPGGQSGTPGSPFYDQMIESWSQGEYYELHFPKSAEDLPDNFWISQTFTTGR